MIKGIVRVDRLDRQQLHQLKTRRSQEAKQNSSFTVHRLWFQMRRNRLLFWIGVVNLSVLLGASVALLTPFLSNPNTLNQGLSLDNVKQPRREFLRNGLPYQISRPVNILIMGIQPHLGVWSTSGAAFSGTSDTMLLLRLDPDRKLLRVLSIPKDSQVVLPEIGLDKISNANSIGGPAFAARIVSRNLNNVPIDRYVRITTDALKQLVDQLGGVEVFVPVRMLYQDKTQHLQIDLDAGWQTLSGEQAQQFARFRASGVGDLDRVQRQQVLLKALRDRLTSPAVLPRLPQIVRIVQSYVDTNLSPAEILAIANFAVELNPDQLQMLLLPGDLSPFSRDLSSYWIYTPGQDQIMNNYFDTYAMGNQKPKALSSLRIAVQNASGKPNLSQLVASYLKQQGFSQVYMVSDWPDSQPQTEIIVQKGNLKAATDLQKVLSLGDIEVAATGDLKSHLTIRVGKDWNSIQLFNSHRDNNSYGWKWGEGSKR